AEAPAAPAAKLVQRTYQVADLVVPIANYTGTDCPAAKGPDGKAAPAQTTEDTLIRLITSTVAPATWSEAGGPGTLQYFPRGMALVVCQTADVQEEVADLLSALRRLQDVEVQVEARVVRLPEACWERLADRLGIDFGKQDPKVGPVTFLND